MPITSFTIDGQEVNPIFGTLEIRESTNGVSTLVCDILSVGSPTFSPALHAPIAAEEDSVKIFAGTLTQVHVKGFGGPNIYDDEAGAPQIVVSVTAESYQRILDRRLITETVDGDASPATSLKDFLQTLVDDYLDDDGVSLHGSQVDGPTLPTLVFDGTRAIDVLASLTKATGYVGGIDYDKTLRMWAPGDLAAPFNIDEFDDPARWTDDVEVERILGDDYANHITVIGDEIDDPFHTETWTSTGVETTFDLDYTFVAFPNHVVFVVTPALAAINDKDAETIQIPTLDEAKWYVDTDANTISRVDGPLPAGTTITWTFHGKTTPRAVAQDAGEIAANGKWEAIVHDPSLTTNAAAQVLADQILSERLISGDLIAHYRSRYVAPTLRAGQVQTITATARELSGDFLITDMSVRAETPATATYSAAGLGLIRSVTAKRQQSILAHWTETYKDWLGGGQRTKVQSNQQDDVLGSGPAPPVRSVQFHGLKGWFDGDDEFLYYEAENSVVCGADSSIDADDFESCQVFGYDNHIGLP